MTDNNSPPWIRWFSDTSAEDVALVGGKNASLGEMYRELGAQGIKVPNGFAVTAAAYREVLDRAGAWPRLREALAGLDANNVSDLSQRAQKAREIVYGSPLPDALLNAIVSAYGQLRRDYGEQVTLAVRSSATAEDLPTASFAGQHETFLNISGEFKLLDTIRRCFASLFLERAIRYRIDNGFDHFKVLLSVGIMKMVRSDLAASGVTFSLDTETGFRDVVFVTAAYGLGENVVQGTVDPDQFYVFKPTFRQGRRVVLWRSLGSKKIRMVYTEAGGRETTHNESTPKADRERYCLTDEEVLQVADATMRIEAHYSEKASHPVPMDVEWAKDGIDGQIYIVQARPETVASRKSMDIFEEHSLRGDGRILIAGHAVGSKAASGKARVITDVAQLDQFRKGEVLVADTTAPDWVTVMKAAAAIVTNRGGRTCHAAIVARELGIPAVVGCDRATTTLETGMDITVSCTEGEQGRVYAGIIPITSQRIDLSTLNRPRTRLMLNLGNPDLAFRTRFLPNDGVGLARMEFIITEYIHAHPMALLHPEKVADADERAQLAQLTRHHESPGRFFVERLAEGVGTIAAFYPKPVIVRMSDFKTNEYASLLGGRWFEAREENPMLGFRGASRYSHPNYAEGFALECAAMKRVREVMGLTNVKLMIPFCRRVQEGERVLAAMAEQGLRRGENGLEIYVMCEIPNNVVQIDAFAALFDGFSIGSNDLTQLVLGVDRDSEIVAFDFDERDPGVKEMIRQTVEGARRNGRHSGICGQAPSDYPDFAAYLVELGIDSISLNPDTILKTTQEVLAVEQRLGYPPRILAGTDSQDKSRNSC